MDSSCVRTPRLGLLMLQWGQRSNWSWSRSFAIAFVRPQRHTRTNSDTDICPEGDTIIISLYVNAILSQPPPLIMLNHSATTRNRRMPLHPLPFVRPLNRTFVHIIHRTPVLCQPSVVAPRYDFGKRTMRYSPTSLVRFSAPPLAICLQGTLAPWLASSS